MVELVRVVRIYSEERADRICYQAKCEVLIERQGSRMTSKFWPKQVDTWSCHFLRWGLPGEERVWEECTI